MDDADIQEIKEKLEEMSDMLDENNRILRGLRRTARLSTLFSVLKWALIIGISIGAFYYIQPIVDSVMKTYQSISGNPIPAGFLHFFGGQATTTK